MQNQLTKLDMRIVVIYYLVLILTYYYQQDSVGIKQFYMEDLLVLFKCLS